MSLHIATAPSPTLHALTKAANSASPLDKAITVCVVLLLLIMWLPCSMYVLLVLFRCAAFPAKSLSENTVSSDGHLCCQVNFWMILGCFFKNRDARFNRCHPP